MAVRKRDYHGVMASAHLVQLDIAWEDKASNHRAVREMLLHGRSGAGGEAPSPPPRIMPGDLIVLPEMFDTGFSLDIERTNDGDGMTESFVAALAGELRCFVVGGATALGADGRGRNRCLVAGPRGEIVARYDKVHPFTYGREGERFSGGREVVTWEWAWTTEDASPEVAGERMRVCPTICYDLRFPELFRGGLDRGAEMFTVIASWPAARASHWRALLIARAIENQAIVLGVNRCGSDPHLRYAGGSMAVDAQGHVLAEADERAQVLSVAVDAGRMRAWRAEFPAWRDRREWLR